MDPELIKALADLAWPLMAVVLLWRLFPLVESIARTRAFTLKVGDMELSAQEASEQLQTQIDDLRQKLSELRGVQVAVPAARPTETMAQSVPPNRVLWVDDIPTNNAYAIAQLQQRGFEVGQAVSTPEAMRRLGEATRYAAVISDMGGTEAGTYRPEAGLELLRAMRQAGHNEPFIVCTTAAAAGKYTPLVTAAGGEGATSSFVDIFDFVDRAMKAAA